MSRYQPFIDRLVAAVAGSPARTDSALRRALVDGKTDAAPEALRPYVEKVARHAWKVTDEDVASLRARGCSEDEIFELTASAAVGAALGRLNRAMAVVREGRS